jgi:hypothetical protein
MTMHVAHLLKNQPRNGYGRADRCGQGGLVANNQSVYNHKSPKDCHQNTLRNEEGFLTKRSLLKSLSLKTLSFQLSNVFP